MTTEKEPSRRWYYFFVHYTRSQTVARPANRSADSLTASASTICAPRAASTAPFIKASCPVRLSSGPNSTFELSPLSHISVISSREGIYATTHADRIDRCSAGSVSSISFGADLSPSGDSSETRAATPPATRSKQSIRASAIAAEAAVMHPARTFIIPHGAS